MKLPAEHISYVYWRAKEGRQIWVLLPADIYSWGTGQKTESYVDGRHGKHVVEIIFQRRIHKLRPTNFTTNNPLHTSIQRALNSAPHTTKSTQLVTRYSFIVAPTRAAFIASLHPPGHPVTTALVCNTMLIACRCPTALQGHTWNFRRTNCTCVIFSSIVCGTHRGQENITLQIRNFRGFCLHTRTVVKYMAYMNSSITGIINNLKFQNKWVYRK